MTVQNKLGIQSRLAGWARAIVSLALLAGSVVVADAGEQYLLVVGVNRYDNNELQALKYPEHDVETLAQFYRDSGVNGRNITIMTRSRGVLDDRFMPLRDRIERELDHVLRQCAADDRIVIALAGHGVQFAGDVASYFCPMDCRLKDKDTLIEIGELYRRLETCKAGFKLLLVDACRNEQEATVRARPEVKLESATRPQAAFPPGGSAAFFSCSSGEKAFEDPLLRHGVFFHFVCEGLRGSADHDSDRRITLPELEQFVKAETDAHVRKEHAATQMPELFNRTRGLVPLADRTRPDEGWLEVWLSGTGSQFMLAEHPLAPVVLGVLPGSKAEASGLRRGDVILEVNGQSLKNSEHLREVLSTFAPGAGVSLTVHRDGNRQNLPVTLASRPTEADRARAIIAAADSGVPWAQEAVGWLYRQGLGVELDLQESCRHFLKTVADGAASADLHEGLGWAYLNGWGVPKDELIAVRHFREAASGGHVGGMVGLGLVHEKGRGVEQDMREAMRWYHLAAERGHYVALNNLGLIALEGRAGEADLAEAFRQISRAQELESRNGVHGTSTANLGFLYHHGFGVEKNLDLAEKYYRLAAADRHTVAIRHLGELMEYGRKDYVEAREWYRKGALAGDAVAMKELGVLFDLGKGVEEDEAEAMKWLLKAGEAGDLDACWWIGLNYERGEGASENIQEAIRWYRKGADAGEKWCQHRMGRCYYNGLGVTKNLQTAFAWYFKAAEQEHEKSMGMVGYLFETGQGTRKDRDEAIRWYRKAAAKDNDYAKQQLKRLRVR